MSDLRIAVCGVRFGEAYLRALVRGVPGVRLAGIVTRGSDRSRRIAAKLGVPHWPDAAHAIPHVDAAVVVVRTGVFGGGGTRLAEALAAGRPVLLEHPVHPTELRRLQERAEAGGAILHVNSVYPEFELVSDFIAAVRAWRCGRPVDDHHPAFVEATTSRQLLYSTLDILGRALGGLAELRVEAPSAVAASGDMTYRPFADLPGTLAACRSISGCRPISSATTTTITRSPCIGSRSADLKARSPSLTASARSSARGRSSCRAMAAPAGSQSRTKASPPIPTCVPPPPRPTGWLHPRRARRSRMSSPGRSVGRSAASPRLFVRVRARPRRRQTISRSSPGHGSWSTSRQAGRHSARWRHRGRPAPSD